MLKTGLVKIYRTPKVSGWDGRQLVLVRTKASIGNGLG